MNFGTASVSPSGDFRLFIPQAQNRRRKSDQREPTSIFLEPNPPPKLKLPSKKNIGRNGNQSDLVVELVQSQSQLNHNNSNNPHKNKRPHSSTPYQHSRSFGSVEEDVHRTSNQSVVGGYSGGTKMSINQPRLPDITMINKYYGLVPKKFTVHSRQGYGSEDYRKLRAKTAFRSSKSIPTKNSSLDDGHSGSGGSDTESNEPTWGKNGHRKRKDAGNSLINSNLRDINSSENSNQSLQTRKISVERQNKLLKHRGRSSSLPLTPSSKGENFAKNANSSPTRENQRVIKIDLSNMSWEETYCPSSCSPVDGTDCPSPDLHTDNRLIENNNYDNNGNTTKKTIAYQELNLAKADTKSAQFTDSLLLLEAEKTAQVVQVRAAGSCEIERDNDYGPPLNRPVTSINNQAQHLFGQSYPEKMKTDSSHKADLEKDTVQNSTCEESVFEMVNSGISNNSTARRERLRKNISFDEQILLASHELGSGAETNPPKSRRPTTASPSSQRPIPPTTTKTPLSQQHLPSKILPWTQKSGKTLTLSERRAKFQKSMSIHSTESASASSFDLIEESSDTETLSSSYRTPPQIVLPPPPHSTTRKSLFFQPPPEVSTMVGQISPIETLEIQVEIEKVAQILNNMQNQNKSFIDLTPDGCCVDISRVQKTETNLPQMTNSLAKNFETISPTKPKSPEEINDASFSDLNGNNCLHKSANYLANQTLLKKESGDNNNADFKAKRVQEPLTFTEKVGNFTGNGVTPTTKCTKNSPTITTPKNQSCPCITCNNATPAAGSFVTNVIPTKVVQIPFRPPLKKAVSISCEKDLFPTSASANNEVNGISNKSSRPRTAVTSKTLTRTSSTPLILVQNKTNHPSKNSGQNVIQIQSRQNKGNKDNNKSQCQPTNQNPGSNYTTRKLLLKKALMEINQSVAQLGNKKWISSMGRPKTAPSIDHGGNKGGGGGGDATKKSNVSLDQRRQPLKTSPATLTGAGNKPGQLVGTKAIPSTTMGRKTTDHAIKQTSTSSSSVGPGHKSENGVGESSESEKIGPAKRTLHRQSFSLDEGMLLGFSNKEFGWSSNSFDKLVDESRMDDAFQSSKKREECLKIYHKMAKTGVTVKLDTIFRGIMTPSEYRAFIKAAENAARELAETEAEEVINPQNGNVDVDAGVASSVKQNKTAESEANK